jgi:hypothetical protein
MPDRDALQIAPGQEVAVALLSPEDAPGVSALFRAVYGQDYPVKTYYDPAALLAANRAGDIISCVARTPGGDIVGHLAMYRIAPCPKVYEGGAAMVLPAYRNTAKVFERMVVLGIKTCPAYGGEGVYGEHVCNHLFTQKAAVTLSNVTMGLAVDLMPASAYDHEKSAQGRVSSLHGFQVLKPHPHTVHLPRVYERELRFIYEGLADTRDLALSTQAPPPDSRSRLTVEVYDFAQVMRVAARELGEDLLAALDGTRAEAAAHGVKVEQLWLPLAAPWVGWAVDELRGRGWFLGGVLPRWFDEDGLMVQRLAEAPRWDDMQILTDRSREVVRLVRRDWERVDGRS